MTYADVTVVFLTLFFFLTAKVAGKNNIEPINGTRSTSQWSKPEWREDWCGVSKALSYSFILVYYSIHFFFLLLLGNEKYY